ncbi:hypothetical protein SPBR_02403 [Sporothrix brasiliensis 5110]|uniref:Uncharacterized protein n=1 Tax=Sporothrix brasiliensis 5110 TaxID=1398154 RepID=A0A0C2IU16_9PEZI|nr:uncharacterized protein SPBR_02403 [Sporothrix brasiliensis 5110]KIH92596.1 hypothetical protein SPBR_02403 [Sporothrix brasiliensis 5110]
MDISSPDLEASSRFTSLSSSASSTISQLQTSLQSAQQAVNTLKQSADDASRSASQASRSASSALASAQSSAASAQASLSSSLAASMLASVSSAEQVMSISMSSVMVAAVASASASFVAQQAAAVANLPTATVTAATDAGLPGTVPEANGASAPQSQPPILQTNRQNNALGACTTPEVVLAFAGIILGAVGLASLGCIVFLWFWKRRPAVTNSTVKKPSGRGSPSAASGTGLSGESRSSGGSLRQWRIRASTTRPKMDSRVAPPSEVTLKEYKLPEYERVFPEGEEAAKAKLASAAAPADSTAPTATAVSSNDRIFSTWSFTTAGGGDPSTANNGNSTNNGSTFFEAGSPTSSARDVVAPLNVYRSQNQVRASRNFSRTSRMIPVSSTNAGTTTSTYKPRPTSSVYEPFGLGSRSEPRGLDRISRMEEEWNRSQMQRATTTAGSAGNKASNALYTTNYAYYTGNTSFNNNNSNNNNNSSSTRTKETTASRYTNKDSADSLAREYHDFVSQLAPVSQYGATPAATANVAAASPSSRSRTQREPTIPPAGPLPGLPSRANDSNQGGSAFSIRPYLQGLI